MRAWSKGLFVALVTLLSVIVPIAGVSATSNSATFQYHIGDSFLASLSAKFGVPSVTMAQFNGDTVAINGTGSLSVQPKSVTGGGMFVHRDSSGNIKAAGTWQAVSLVSFVSYGSGSAQGLPASLFGGKALILVNLLVGRKVVHTGILTVVCALGNPPEVAHDGIRLVVQDTPFNFNDQVSGFTVYVQS